MLKKSILSNFVAVGALVAAGAVSAEAAVTTQELNMRANPSARAERVGVVPAGASLDVHHCLSRSPWCSVSYGGTKGWASARFIDVADPASVPLKDNVGHKKRVKHVHHTPTKHTVVKTDNNTSAPVHKVRYVVHSSDNSYTTTQDGSQQSGFVRTVSAPFRAVANVIASPFRSDHSSNSYNTGQVIEPGHSSYQRTATYDHQGRLYDSSYNTGNGVAYETVSKRPDNTPGLVKVVSAPFKAAAGIISAPFSGGQTNATVGYNSATSGYQVQGKDYVAMPRMKTVHYMQGEGQQPIKIYVKEDPFRKAIAYVPVQNGSGFVTAHPRVDPVVMKNTTAPVLQQTSYNRHGSSYSYPTTKVKTVRYEQAPVRVHYTTPAIDDYKNSIPVHSVSYTSHSYKNQATPARWTVGHVTPKPENIRFSLGTPRVHQHSERVVSYNPGFVSDVKSDHSYARKETRYIRY